MTHRMARETAADRDREEAIIARLAHLWGCAITPLAQHYQLDGAITRNGQLVGWLEIKTCSIISMKAESFHIRAEKCAFGMMMARQFGIGFIVAVQFEDRLGWHRFVDLKTYRIIITTRYQEGREGESGPMLMVPMELFDWEQR